jgi:hypothetical protein
MNPSRLEDKERQSMEAVKIIVSALRRRAGRKISLDLLSWAIFGAPAKHLSLIRTSSTAVRSYDLTIFTH